VNVILAAGAATGGVADVFQRVIAELRARGHDVALVRPMRGRTAAGAAVGAVRRERQRICTAEAIHLEFGSNDLGAFWFALCAVLIRRDCVVVAHDYPKLINAPTAGLVPASSRWLRALAFRVLRPVLDSRLRRLLLRRAGLILVFGEEARAGWERAGVRRIQVITHGSDPASDGAPPPSKGDSILFAGYLGPSKGIDDLLQAWAAIEEDVELPLVFAGAPHEPWFSQTLGQYHGLSKPPSVLGPLPQAEAFQRLIERAAVVVLPYRYSSPASGVLIRAMAAGRAVIVTPVPATRTVVRDGHNAIIVPIGDATALAQALRCLDRDPGLRDQLGAAAARTAAEVFSWERQTDQLEAAYATASPVGSARLPDAVDGRLSGETVG
jgi:glycosyltransferase involved in cell wall biosynthesis